MIIHVEDTHSLLYSQILSVKALVVLLNVCLYLFVCLIYFHSTNIIFDHNPVNMGVCFFGRGIKWVHGGGVYISWAHRSGSKTYPRLQLGGGSNSKTNSSSINPLLVNYCWKLLLMTSCWWLTNMNGTIHICYSVRK